ncbi:siderophore-interacting protein [Nonomuraea sp. SBT364]|uniref:siderophore-interacting protein n=1 Tax=Nonomuraea sp. SBT364 TaxID=1580530 RepID=UPI001E5838B2|nr:siderophore-interacting protein [Nonomuraea sp. SBT364]
MRTTERLSPSFLRVTFTGADLERFADNGYDQRIKLILPLEEHGLSPMPKGPDWYQRWRELPGELRNPIRTLTVRLARPHLREVDVDIALHEDDGHGGPMARWAPTVQPGAPAILFGPNAGFDGPNAGMAFRPDAENGPVLLAGDETAVPAIASVLERLPAGCTGEALMEVPYDSDALDILTPSRVKITWLARSGARRGSLLHPAVVAAADRLLPPLSANDSVEDVDVNDLWEVPEDERPPGPLYAWLAGEAAVIKGLRRHLVADRGMDRRAVAFMGYWREGRSEQD